MDSPVLWEGPLTWTFAMPYLLRTGALLFAALALSACSSLSTLRTPVPGPLAETAAVAASTAGEPIRYWGDEPLPPTREFAGRGADRQAQYLSLSGGGANGAYGAGYLVGWSQRGDRPEFEVVTGISVGALIAPMAFLGPGYDTRLQQVFVDLATWRDRGPGVLAALFGAPGIASNRPVMAAIARLVDAPTLDAIAREHQKGRRLLIGTTNLDAERPVIWDIGAIASSNLPNRLQLVRQIMLASAAIPGIYPPVLIKVQAGGRTYDELHVDGAVTQQILLFPNGFDAITGGGSGNRQLYVIYNGMVEPSHESVEISSLAVLERSIPTLLKYRGRGEISLLSNAARAEGIRYRMTAIPPEFPDSEEIFPSPEWLAKLYAYGVENGRLGTSQSKE